MPKGQKKLLTRSGPYLLVLLIIGFLKAPGHIYESVQLSYVTGKFENKQRILQYISFNQGWGTTFQMSLGLNEHRFTMLLVPKINQLIMSLGPNDFIQNVTWPKCAYIANVLLLAWCLGILPLSGEEKYRNMRRIKSISLSHPLLIQAKYTVLF